MPRDITVRVTSLRERAPDTGLAGETTPAQRVALVWTLTQEAWALSGRPIPKYARHEMPVVVRSLRDPEQT